MYVPELHLNTPNNFLNIFQDGKHTTALHYSVKNDEDDTSLHIVDFLAQNT